MPLPRLSGVPTPGASPSLPTGPAAAAGPRYGLDKVDDVQAYLSRPDVAAACDEARVRFVEPCGPGGTDIPMRLKRHRSDADFEVVRGKVGSGRCGSCRLWLTGVPFIPPPPSVHRCPFVQATVWRRWAADRGVDAESEQDFVAVGKRPAASAAARRFSFPMNS